MVSICVKNSRVGRKTPNKQTTKTWNNDQSSEEGYLCNNWINRCHRWRTHDCLCRSGNLDQFKTLNISANPKDDVPLTPNHFLHGQVGGVFVPDTVDNTEFNPGKRWRRIYSEFSGMGWFLCLRRVGDIPAMLRRLLMLINKMKTEQILNFHKICIYIILPI